MPGDDALKRHTRCLVISVGIRNTLELSHDAVPIASPEALVCFPREELAPEVQIVGDMRLAEVYITEERIVDERLVLRCGLGVLTGIYPPPPAPHPGHP